jgi:hypothetical protein
VVEEEQQHVTDGDELGCAADGAEQEVARQIEPALAGEQDGRGNEQQGEREARQRDVDVAQKSTCRSSG